MFEEVDESRWQTLAALSNASAQILDSLVDGLERDALLDIAETALNIIIGNIPTSEAQLRELRRHKRELLELTDTNTSLNRRKLLLRGGLAKRVLTIAKPHLLARSQTG